MRSTEPNIVIDVCNYLKGKGLFPEIVYGTRSENPDNPPPNEYITINKISTNYRCPYTIYRVSFDIVLCGEGYTRGEEIANLLKECLVTVCEQKVDIRPGKLWKIVPASGSDRNLIAEKEKRCVGFDLFIYLCL